MTREDWMTDYRLMLKDKEHDEGRLDDRLQTTDGGMLNDKEHDEGRLDDRLLRMMNG